MRPAPAALETLHREEDTVSDDEADPAQTTPPEPAPPEAAPPEPAPLEPAPPEDIPNALRFIHAVEMQTRARVAELSANLSALVDTLIGEGRLPLDAYEKRRRLAIVRENEREDREIRVDIADAPDKYALTDLPSIDCEARVHLCKARCCTLDVTLSVQDLDERVARWDYGRPYRIAQRDDGYCVHNEGGACSIYAARPAACRAYDCRSDRRIWLDFERRIPAP